MGSRWGEPARSQAVLRASITVIAARRRVPSAAGPPTGDCGRCRSAILAQPRILKVWQIWYDGRPGRPASAAAPILRRGVAVQRRQRRSHTCALVAPMARRRITGVARAATAHPRCPSPPPTSGAPGSSAPGADGCAHHVMQASDAEALIVYLEGFTPPARRDEVRWPAASPAAARSDLLDAH